METLRMSSSTILKVLDIAGENRESSLCLLSTSRPVIIVSSTRSTVMGELVLSYPASARAAAIAAETYVKMAGYLCYIGATFAI